MGVYADVDLCIQCDECGSQTDDYQVRCCSCRGKLPDRSDEADVARVLEHGLAVGWDAQRIARHLEGVASPPMVAGVRLALEALGGARV